MTEEQDAAAAQDARMPGRQGMSPTNEGDDQGQGPEGDGADQGQEKPEGGWPAGTKQDAEGEQVLTEH